MKEIGLIDLTKLKEAIKSLNDSGLIDPKIKSVGKTKEQLIEDFTNKMDDLIENHPDKTDKIPQMVADMWNFMYGTDDAPPSTPAEPKEKVEAAEPQEKVETEAPKKEKKAKEPKPPKEPKEKKERGPGERIIWLKNKIAEAKYTKKELVEMYLEQWGGSKLTPATALADGKNPNQLGTKYDRFKKLILVNGDGVMSFDTLAPVKPKPVEAPAEAPAEAQ